jgi:SAM-dependent methyltransferase
LSGNRSIAKTIWKAQWHNCHTKTIFLSADLMNDKQHWETVYVTSAPNKVSWHQPTAARSLALICEVAPALDAPIIDVGGGASVLVDELLRAGYRDLTVLDIAASALELARARLGPVADRVRWLEGDVRTAPLASDRYVVWHDRAVFHFLTDAADRAAYVGQVQRALRLDGFVIVATFAEDGPTKCSGLPVVRYSPEALNGEFGAGFELLKSEREVHVTPVGIEQPFTYCLLRWKGGGASQSARPFAGD